MTNGDDRRWLFQRRPGYKAPRRGWAKRRAELAAAEDDIKRGFAPRLALDVARATAKEMLRCVEVELARQGAEQMHLTKVAAKMLAEALR